MAFWLIKSEPEAWSWADQVREEVTSWTGVRNHQAAKFLRGMRLGDLCLFYHSVSERRIVGIVEVVAEAVPDPTASDGPWVSVEVKTVRSLVHPVSLAAIKAEPRLHDFFLVRQSRLSVMPVEEETWDLLLGMGHAS